MRTSELMRDQVDSIRNATGPDFNIENPGRRRGSSLRSPLRLRTSSTPDTSEVPQAVQVRKGKGTKGRRTPGSDGEKEAYKREVFKDDLEKIGRYVRKVKGVIKNIYKPKQELKDVSSGLLLQVEKFQSIAMSELLEGKVTNINYVQHTMRDVIRNYVQGGSNS